MIFMKKTKLTESRLVSRIWLLEGVICAAVILIDLAI